MLGLNGGGSDADDAMVNVRTLEKVDLDALAERATSATTEEDRAECLADIEVALDGATSLGERARLLLCRARVRTNRWQTREVLEDALTAMSLFEQAGDVDGTLDAASLGAGWASRLGQLSLAAELATRCIVRLGDVVDDSLVVEVTNRLGVFCYSFMDYARAVVQFESSLAAAERCGDRRRVHRQLHNIADTLLLSARQDISGAEDAVPFTDRATKLARAEQVVRRMIEEGTPELCRRTGVHRLQAELLCEQGRYTEALVMLRQSRAGAPPAEFDPTESNLALVEARCLRAIGRPAEAVAAVRRAAEIAEPSEDNQETMLILDELVEAEEDMGDLRAALRDARLAKKKMWDIHRVQTAQLVEQVWVRAAVEQERRGLETQAAAAVRSAEEDLLTRIGNRRLLERSMTELPAQSNLSVLMADIDHFKRINDTFGHDVGDDVLRAIGEILAREARTGHVVIRYGGDEFLVALPSVALSSAGDFAERLRLKISAHRWADIEPRLSVTVSIGVATGAVWDWPSVLTAADDALYRAKGSGRDRVDAEAEQRSAGYSAVVGVVGGPRTGGPQVGPDQIRRVEPVRFGLVKCSKGLRVQVAERSDLESYFRHRLVVGSFDDGHDVVLSHCQVGLLDLPAERFRYLFRRLPALSSLCCALRALLGPFPKHNVHGHRFLLCRLGAESRYRPRRGLGGGWRFSRCGSGQVGTGRPARQQSKTDQQISLRNRWSSRTSSRTWSGSCSRCQRHSSLPALSPSRPGAAARTALIA